jgi:hypothetical protein|eukprot:31198-Pelagococcus_subviridis.AAC.32
MNFLLPASPSSFWSLLRLGNTEVRSCGIDERERRGGQSASRARGARGREEGERRKGRASVGRVSSWLSFRCSFHGADGRAAEPQSNET